MRSIILFVFMFSSLLKAQADCDPFSGGQCSNYIHLVAGNDIDDDASFGLSDNINNFTILFEDNFINSNIPFTNFEIAQAETLVHEFGHQFELNVGTFPVVHDFSAATDFHNHEESDQGVMASDRVRDEGEAEFFIDCIYWIRDLIDGI